MNTSDLKSKLAKSLDYLKSELSQIQTGRAKPALIEDVAVTAYGSEMSVKELGSIIVQDPQNIVITPWDKNLLGSIAKAIRESDLNLNPVEESDRLRLPVPTLTEERRVELAKVVSTKVEETKQSMRNVRQEAMKDIDNAFSEKEIGEDEKFTQREEVEDICRDYVEEAEEIGENKKGDIMTV